MPPPVASTLLREILVDLTQGVMLVDAAGQVLWANAAALAMHGCTKEADLLLTAPAYQKQFDLRFLNHHQLGVDQYPLARLAAGEAFDALAVQLQRRDDGEFERVLQMRGRPAVKDDDNAGPAALLIEDLTEQVSAQERFERMFASNPAPALLLRLEDSRYIKVNEGFLQMTGYRSDDIVGRALHELDVLHDAEHRDAALDALREHGTIAQQESQVPVKGGGSRFVVIAGQPLEVDETACMLFTFIDLERRKQAETALKASQESFSTAFRLAPVPMLICAHENWAIKEVNDAFVALMEYPAGELQEKSLPDLKAGRASDFPAGLRRAVHADTSVRKREIRLRTGTGVDIDCLLSVEPVAINNEADLLCVVQDITERKRSEADLFDAIEAVMKDTSWFSRSLIEKLAQVRHAHGADTGLAELTPREREVLELICRGQTDAQIAATLQLSRHTVRNHVSSLYNKIGVNRRSAAVIWGRERGLAAF